MEPEYIPISREIEIMKEIHTHDSLNMQKGHWSLSFELLTKTLHLMYGNTDFSELIKKQHYPNESEIFSKNMTKVIEIYNWSISTARTIFHNMKKILYKTQLNQGFINTISWSKKKEISRTSDEFCLPSKYKKLSKNNKTKYLLLEWIKDSKMKTKFKSHTSIRQFISFIITFLENLGFPVEEWNDTTICQINNINIDMIKYSSNKSYPKMQPKIKINYIINFLKNMLRTSISFNELQEWKKTTISTIKIGVSEDTDVHRISNIELDLMYNASKKNIRNETIFVLMTTTGMRVGGVSNIKLCNVSTSSGKDIIINSIGRTLEKGNKWFSFTINEKLKILLYEWITKYRKCNSSYLFPGRGEDIGITPNRISNIIKEISKDAGLEGKHIHAHAIRHSFAHILLENGNSPELVSKMLGHSCSKTTEQYYLKESAVEVSKRCNIPWLHRDPEEKKLPGFMITSGITIKNKDTSGDTSKEASKELSKKSLRNKRLALEYIKKDLNNIH